MNIESPKILFWEYINANRDQCLDIGIYNENVFDSARTVAKLKALLANIDHSQLAYVGW